MNCTKSSWVLLCVGGKTGGAIWVRLYFGLHLLHQGKGGNDTPEELIEGENNLE
jgi:hypothetical protein